MEHEKDRLKQMLDCFHKYDSEHMAFQAFGLSEDVEYDALVIAPSFTPYKLRMDTYCKVTTLKEGAYIGGYLVEKDGLKIAWIKIASSAGNLIDHLALCAELKFRQMIFIGAVGALKEEIELGDVCTPSIVMEYVHLDEIRSLDTDLIEMETSSFYLMTELFEIPGIALLVVSDNSASGAPLVGRSDAEQERYDHGREVVLPDMILTLAGR